MRLNRLRLGRGVSADREAIDDQTIGLHGQGHFYSWQQLGPARQFEGLQPGANVSQARVSR
jgi:hypothetical protein